MNYLKVARKIALEAGELIKYHLDDALIIEEKSSNLDVVTEADKATEQLIRQRIMKTYPNHLFLGEEEAYENKEAFDHMINQVENIPYLWIVDPIDGTNNFVQQIPGFVVSIALVCRGELTVGVIYDPMRDEMFSAEKGQGAFMNEKEIHVAPVEKLEHAVFGTSFSSDHKVRSATVKSVEVILPKCRTIRVLGAAAQNLAFVAIGRLTAFWHFGLNVWDVAAGILIIQEAGGKVTNKNGEKYQLSDKTIYVSNGKIHDQLLNDIKVLG